MNNAVFFDNDCPKYATFFEASNDTVDCKGAMPISSFGLKGDRFCENICSGVSHAIHTLILAKKHIMTNSFGLLIVLSVFLNQVLTQSVL